MAGKGHPKKQACKPCGAVVRARRIAALRTVPFPKVANVDWAEFTVRPMSQTEYDAIKAEMQAHTVPIAVYYADKVMTPFGLGTRQAGGHVVLDQVPEPSHVVMALAATGQPPLPPEDMAALESEYSEFQRGIDDMRSMPHGASFRIAGRGFGKSRLIADLQADIDAGRVSFKETDVTAMGEASREKYRPDR